VSELRVLIVADDPLTSAGLAAVLAEDPECRVVGQIGTGAGWAGELEQLNPDVVVWDLGWDSEDLLQGAVDMISASPPVLALVADPGQAHRLWAAGARGILPRDGDVGAFPSAIHSLAQGLAVFDPGLLRSLVSPLGEGPAETSSPLTRREMEVLRLLADGMSNRGIAANLQISEHTVKFHVNSIMSKLNAESRTEAVVSAMRRGIISF
jgi:DNA-binding NarL/FixJ family response regulator